MGKIKKSIAAAKRASKNAQRQESVANNPFEVRVNKKKYEILGRKMKHERGLPGVSRSKALKKREKTLLIEYKQKNKANVFMDKRFGENDSEMTLEDKLLKRFAIEKQKHHEKTGIYNLEEEELTHLGQSLGDIDKFEDVRLSDIEDDENENLAESHFGGFLKKKQQTESGKEHEKPKTRKEIMEEVVAKAKLKKNERQKAKEENTNMTDMLDQDWMEITRLMSFREPHPKQDDNKIDDYDITVKELAYEAKGKATNRLKTEAEIAKEEQERLKKLEEERLRRMKGITLSNKPVHVSADDLGDSFSIPEDTRTMLSYDDGKINLPDGEETIDYEWLNKGDKEEKESEDSDQESDEEDGNSDGDDVSGEEDDQDSGNDLESDQGSEDECQKPAMKIVKEKKTLKQTTKSRDKTITPTGLPFTFLAPQSYDSFKKLIKNWPEKDHITIIERIKACNHPKINPGNKSKMETFLAILLQYLGELAQQENPELKTVDKLTRLLFDIAQFSPVHTCQCMQTIIKEEHEEYMESKKQRGGRSSFPGLKTILYLRLVSIFFPTSDLKHCVCTSTMVFMSQMLTQTKVSTISDVLRGLFICSLYFEFVSFSKRYVPEVINFLCGVLYLASEKTPVAPQVVPPFKKTGKSSELLRITDNQRDVIPTKINLVEVFSDLEENDSLQAKVSAVYLALQLTSRFVKIYQTLPAFKEIFLPIKAHLQRISVHMYHDMIKDLHSSIIEQIYSFENQSRKHLALHTRKPEALKTFAPKFQEHYEIKSRKSKQGSKKNNEKEKLKYKLKREFKGAVREIRKDSQFLSRQKLKEQLERDAERLRKVKEIEHLLSNEQAEVNELNRKKRKKR